MGFPMSIMWGRLCNRYVTSNASISERQKLVFAPRTYAIKTKFLLVVT